MKEMKMSNEERPLVSVSILTYNQERFIAQTIESVLAQEVDFTYEIVIAEDCSTDRTREIVVEYANRYPALIKLILQKSNKGISGNSNSLRRACRGYFRAHLEGDDYWSDREKLKRQVDFLCSHPEYIGIGGAFDCCDEDDKKTAYPVGVKQLYSADEVFGVEHIKKWLLPAHASALTYRNVFYSLDQKKLEVYENAEIVGDRKLATFLAYQGNIYCERKVVLHRRVLRKSKSSYTTNWENLKNQSAIAYRWHLEVERVVKEWFGEDVDYSLRKEGSWKNSLKRFGKAPTKSNFMVVASIFKMSKQKRHYLKLAAALLLKTVKEKKKETGLFGLLKAFFAYPAKALRRCKEMRNKEAGKEETFIKKNF